MTAVKAAISPIPSTTKRPALRKGIRLGGLAFGGLFGRVEKAKAIRTIQTAFDVGITWFDTSPSYGEGRAEEVLGDALEKITHHVGITTKSPTLDMAAQMVKGRTRDAILRSIEGSLRRLNREFVDLYLLDGPLTPTCMLEAVTTAEGLRRAGVAKSIGICTPELETLGEIIQHLRLDAVQAPYNILTRLAEARLLSFCRDHDIAFHACEPLCRGLLAGRLHKNSVFDEGDLRILDRRFRGERFRRNIEIVNRLRAYADLEDISLLQLSLGWVLQHPTVASIVCGAKSPQQASELAASHALLTPAQVLEVELIVGEDRFQQPE